MVRAAEVIHACDEALRIIECLSGAGRARRRLRAARGKGPAATEAPPCSITAPLEEEGTIAEARIVPPTLQNPATMEGDLTAYIDGFLDLPDDALTWRCEQTIRNYDPCISCATHFFEA